MVSYFEGIQNLQYTRWDAQEVGERLEKAMGRAFQRVHVRATRDACSMRDAAFREAVETLAEAE